MFYLGNYLLLKRDPGLPETMYLCYFADRSLEWYPEWSIDLGSPVAQRVVTTVDLKISGGPVGIYRRLFEKGEVLVNPTQSPITVQLPKPMQQVTPEGGGAVGKDGTVTPTPSLVHEPAASSVVVAPKSAVILLHPVSL